jgi:hypothetical protein
MSKSTPTQGLSACHLQGFIFQGVCYDPRFWVNLGRGRRWNTQLLILQQHPGLNLQCRGVVQVTTKIGNAKVCLEYHIFDNLGPTFILIGIPLRALLRGEGEGGELKLSGGNHVFN